MGDVSLDYNSINFRSELIFFFIKYPIICVGTCLASVVMYKISIKETYHYY